MNYEKTKTIEKRYNLDILEIERLEDLGLVFPETCDEWTRQETDYKGESIQRPWRLVKRGPIIVANFESYTKKSAPNLQELIEMLPDAIENEEIFIASAERDLFYGKDRIIDQDSKGLRSEWYVYSFGYEGTVKFMHQCPITAVYRLLEWLLINNKLKQ